MKTEKGKSLFIDHEKSLFSVHGQIGISCVNCHSDLKDFEDFPHPEKLKPVNCGECHKKATEEFMESIHKMALIEKESLNVSCADCHGKQDIKSKDEHSSRVFPLNLPRTCEKYHAGAGTNFTKGKIHAVSKKASNKWAYFVKIFYIILIASIASVFFVFITADFFHRLSKKWRI